ncbi:MAG: 3-isopropylmalate dehydratase small subunit [Pseudomonadota bacterium]
MPEPFVKHTGTAVALLRDHIDTDQIIPSREMKTVSRKGLADGLFAGWRYAEPGGRHPNPDFALNAQKAHGASVLVTGKNFGCGSSREHAVWALAEYGFRAIIAESFNSIFHGNCLRNGILPITLDDQHALEGPTWTGGETVTIDLPTQTVAISCLPEWVGRFAIDDYPKRLLLEGLDPIGLTLQSSDLLDAFEARDREARPWVYADYSAAKAD